MTMRERPWLLLDVDGPLNPYAAKPTRRPEGYKTLRLRPAGWTDRKPLRVWLCPDHGPLLLDLAGRLNADLAWCTTWEHDANQLIGPELGLPELPVVEFVATTAARKPFRWKYDAAAEFVGDRPVVWLDDDFNTYPVGRDRFLASRGDLPTLLLDVSPRTGITATTVATVDSWHRIISKKGAKR